MSELEKKPLEENPAKLNDEQLEDAAGGSIIRTIENGRTLYFTATNGTESKRFDNFFDAKAWVLQQGWSTDITTVYINTSDDSGFGKPKR